MQLKRLKHCPAGNDAKIRAILGKVYEGALYGIEAAMLAPAKVAKLSTAVIDAFRSRNDDHNVDRFYATLTKATHDLDPMVQILCRRVLQIRRTCTKQNGATEEVKRLIKRYANKHKQGDRWPRWF